MKGRKRFRYREGHGLGDPFWFILFLSFVAGLLMVCAGFSSCNKSVVVMMEGTITSASYTEMMDKNGAIYRVYDITIDNKTLFTLKESVKPGIQAISNRAVGDHVYVYHDTPIFGSTTTPADSIGSVTDLADARKNAIEWNEIAVNIGIIGIFIPLTWVVLRAILWVAESYEIVSDDERSFHRSRRY